MEEVDKEVLRRILFAVQYLPTDCPGYWEAICKFACSSSPDSNNLDAQKIRVLVENIQELDERAFATDITLRQELQAMSHGAANPLGIVLVSHRKNCLECGGKLLLRGDRPSRVTVYTESQGTVLGSHYTKFCQNYRKGCSYNQHYGYFSTGTKSTSYYDPDWEKYPYFVSTSQTAFELALLKRFDFELLIGEISYKQKSEIYNCINGYDNTRKKCSHVQSTRYVCHVTLYILNWYAHIANSRRWSHS